jgi:hypothetical protein
LSTTKTGNADKSGGQLARGGFVLVLFLVLIFTFLVGLLYWGSASPRLTGPVYPGGLAPLFAVLVIGSLAGLVVLTVRQTAYPALAYAPGRGLLLLGLLLAILTGGALVALRLWEHPEPRQEDIYFLYLDGQRLLNGENPYARILAGDMAVNQKYSTYFPLFYQLSWLSQRLGLKDFPDWLSAWKVVFTLANLGIALLLFVIPARRGRYALAAFAALFWLFNRWTVHVTHTGDIDFLALLLMLLSLSLFPRRRLAACLLLGASMAIKQVGIFLAPLYLLWVWQYAKEKRLGSVVWAVIAIAAVPVLASLPFLAWNAEGFVRSIIFSATRNPTALDALSLEARLGTAGMLARLPVVILLGSAYWVSGRYRPGIFASTLLVMAAFVAFNSVMYTSYLVWVMPFIPLAIAEMLDAHSPLSTQRPRSD